MASAQGEGTGGVAAQRLAGFSREQLALGGAAVAACALCWAWSLHAAARMHHGSSLWPLFAMWAVMMAGMMIPPELPTAIRLAGRDFVVFLAGYLLPWLAFSFAVAAAQAALHDLGLIDHGMALVGRAAPAAVLAAAGICELSPLKRACLLRCRCAPESFGPRPLGAGTRSGIASLGSCGVLMLVLFVTGVMSVPAMAALTALLVLERVLPSRAPVSATAGFALLYLAALRVLT